MAITSCIPVAARLAFLRGELNAADNYRIGLFKATTGRTYDATNNSAVLGDIQAATSDEVANGNGYTTCTDGAGGQALSGYTTGTSGSTAYIDWTSDPQWTASTFSTDGCFIYDDSDTVGPNRIVAIFDFGGTKTVTSGTLTLQFPAAGATALIRIG